MLPALVERCVKAVREKKAVDVVVLDVRALSSITDYFLLCSGSSDKQVQAIADSVEEAMRQVEERYLGCEGYQGGHWILMDYHELVVHIFHHETRAYYDLERLWGAAPRWVDEEEAATSRARRR